MQKLALCDDKDVSSSQSAQEDIPAANQPLSTKYNNINVSWHKSIGKLLCESMSEGINVRVNMYILCNRGKS